MPVALLLAYLTMMPRIQAEGQLSAMQATTLGSSVSYDKDSVEEEHRRLESIAFPNARKRRRAPVATLADLEALGIPVVRAAEGEA